nr:ribonuclease [Mycoplana azooxidifex]
MLAASLPLAVSGCGEEQTGAGDGKTVQQGEAPTAPAPTAGGQRTASPAARPTSVPIGHGFDFYVLSLSWSPTWCMDNDASGRSEQCRTGRNAGFIVHGLWPQNERGHPEFCRAREPDRVPSSLGRSYLDIIPSMGLIGHQWRKHGSCSGLSQGDYLAVTRAAFERIELPDEIEDAGGGRIGAAETEAALVAANPGLSERGIAVTCDDGRLDEIRICMTPGLGFRDCPEVDRAACRTKTITQPPIR